MAEQTQFIKMTLVVFRFVAATQHSGRLLVRPTLRHKNCLQLERNTSAYRHFSLSYSRNIAYQIKDNLRDCYNLLNVDEECTLDELKEAYFKLAKVYHPDSGCSTADAKKFNQIKEACKAIKAKIEAGSETSAFVPEDNHGDDDEDDFLFKGRQAQHRPFLENEGYGLGTRAERQKQYEQMKVSRAQQSVFKYRVRKKMTEAEVEAENSLVERDKKYTRKQKISNSMERLVEDMIQEAMSKGDFQNLAGVGKPLDFSKDNPHMDKITQKMNQMLIDNDFQPDWIMLQKEIREDLQKCRERLAVEKRLLGEPPYSTTQETSWENHKESFQINLTDINAKIFKFNLMVPMLHRQIMPYVFDRELKRVCDNCDEYLPKNFEEIKEYREKIKSAPPVTQNSGLEHPTLSDAWNALKYVFGRPKS
ncbi:dnaJ homolog subfamily C member 28-like [Dreissena polymorpha]|nr:dnaJ homolog subfamily C member 28-like [Dreissena polymorpha]XP_052246984.1 dnaJ homolog subfamily C member 28-like [Dreissena polymorpha]